MTRDGRTVFFVSLDLETVRDLCPRVLFMRAGRLHEEGDAAGTIAAYVGSNPQA